MHDRLPPLMGQSSSNVILFQSIEAHRRTWTRQRLSLKPGSSNTTQSHQILGSKQLSHEPMSLPSFKKYREQEIELQSHAMMR